ncbi:MAG: response regulator [Oligoflexales bacterium]
MSSDLYQGLNVLIVDDHDPMRQALKKIMTRLGFAQVHVAFDGSDALEVLEKNRIHLVVCDLYMRKVDGFHVIRTIRNRDIGHDIPILVVTGEAEKDDIIKAVDLGAHDYLIKPFQAEVVEERIEQMIQSFQDPSQLVKLLHSADTCFQSQDYETAETLYLQAMQLDPTSQRARHALAIVVRHRGDFARSIELLEDNIQMSSSYYKNYAALADIYSHQQMTSKAIENLKKELNLNPKQPIRQAYLAKILLQNKDVLGAIEHYRASLKEDPKFKKALYGAGHAYAKKGDLEKAIYYFKRLRRQAPNETRALEAVVKHCLAAQEPRKAEIVLMNEKGDHPERLDAYECLARFYRATERPTDALKVLTQLLIRSPQDPGGLRMKATLEQEAKDFTAAAESWMELTKVEPSRDAFLNLAKNLLQLKQVQPSLKALHRVIFMDPKCGEAFYMLAEVYRRTRQYAKAWHMYHLSRVHGVKTQETQKFLKSCAASMHKRRGGGSAA